MGKPVTTAQSHAVMAILATNIKWENIDGEGIQSFVKNPKEAGQILSEVLKQAKYWNPYIRQITPAWHTHTLSPTKDERRIANCGHLFTWAINPIFNSTLFAAKSPPTEEQKIAVFEVMKEGTVENIFGSFEFSKIAFTQEQVIDLVEFNRELLYYGAQNLVALLISGVPYIVSINVSSAGKINIHANHYESHKEKYMAENRVILPITLEMPNTSNDQTKLLNPFTVKCKYLPGFTFSSRLGLVVSHSFLKLFGLNPVNIERDVRLQKYEVLRDYQAKYFEGTIFNLDHLGSVLVCMLSTQEGGREGDLSLFKKNKFITKKGSNFYEVIVHWEELEDAWFLDARLPGIQIKGEIVISPSWPTV